jgi:hypothetical protein
MKCSVSHSGQIHGTPPATAHDSRVLCNHVENVCTIGRLQWHVLAESRQAPRHENHENTKRTKKIQRISCVS